MQEFEMIGHVTVKDPESGADVTKRVKRMVCRYEPEERIPIIREFLMTDSSAEQIIEKYHIKSLNTFFSWLGKHVKEVQSLSLQSEPENDTDMANKSKDDQIRELKDRMYTIDSKSYELYPHPNAQDCRLYEVTGDGDKLIKSVEIGRTPTEGKYDIWISAQIFIESYLYAGKKYKLVIPSESFTVSPPVKEHGDLPSVARCNYIKNEELVYTFIGTNPTECVLLDCNVADNATVSSLYNVVWTFEGDYHLSDDITTVTYQSSLSSGQPVGAVKKSVKITKTQGGANTAVMVDFVDSSTGKPTTVNKGTKSTITVPKGLIVNSSNEDIVNDENVLTIIGGAEDPAELVNVNITVEGVHSSSHDAVKGREYNFTLTPAENWEVESVSTGGRELSPVVFDNSTNTYSYQLSTLRGDTDVNARYRYVGEWAQSNETNGVWTISDSNVRIYKDADYIVVEGVNSANTINVYTVGGMLVNSTRVSADKDCVRITVSPGQYYIVTVDGIAAKLKM